MHHNVQSCLKPRETMTIAQKYCQLDKLDYYDAILNEIHQEMRLFSNGTLPISSIPWLYTEFILLVPYVGKFFITFY